jgi:hypothetical protein
MSILLFDLGPPEWAAHGTVDVKTTRHAALKAVPSTWWLRCWTVIVDSVVFHEPTARHGHDGRIHEHQHRFDDCYNVRREGCWQMTVIRDEQESFDRSAGSGKQCTGRMLIWSSPPTL